MLSLILIDLVLTSTEVAYKKCGITPSVSPICGFAPRNGFPSFFIIRSSKFQSITKSFPVKSNRNSNYQKSSSGSTLIPEYYHVFMYCTQIEHLFTIFASIKIDDRHYEKKTDLSKKVWEIKDNVKLPGTWSIVRKST